MTETIHPKSTVRRWFLIGLAGWLAGCGLINEMQSKENTMTAKNMTLWQAIGALEQQIPFTKAKIEGLLSTVLTETDNTGNDVFQFYKSRRIELGGGVEISNVDLRIKRNGPHPGFMVWDISGTCIKLAQVRSHYGEMQITDMPRGHSLDEETSYSTMRTWGKLSFGFAERNPDCLASIAFDPNAMK
jgi:hypothetical protein